MLRTQFKSKNFLVIFAADLILLALSLWLAFLIRFDFVIPHEYQLRMLHILPFYLLVKVLVFFVFNLYRGMWRYTSLPELVNILKASMVATLVITTAHLFLPTFEIVPRAVILADLILTFIFISGIRVSVRYIYLIRPKIRQTNIGDKEIDGTRSRVLIIGAGDAGEKILREIRDSQYVNSKAVGFLDDDPRKRGVTIHGVSVFGPISDLEKYKNKIDEILICVPTASGEQMRRIVDFCKKSEKPFKTLPGIWEIIDGSIGLQQIREVSILDLLGREEVKLDRNSIERFIQNKIVLVTGGGGSIGSELVRQVLSFSPGDLVIADFGEFNLFQMEQELKTKKSKTKIHTVLVDVRNPNATERMFKQYHPQIVLHAAAYKHVPIQEYYPWEAIHTNVGGTRKMIELSRQNHVESFVLVSTDKAVRPKNVMGATKRIAEMLIHCENGNSSTKFMTVRFGNVIGSSGSVIPTFKEQISHGGPVTVTHPDIERYFMSIPEAAQLILQAGALGQGGETFVLDMGKPIKIDALARDLVRLSGMEPGVDIDIVYSGLRPGEKLYEELIADTQTVLPTTNHKIMTLISEHTTVEQNDLLMRQIDELQNIASMYNQEEIRLKLKEIVDEYDISSL